MQLDAATAFILHKLEAELSPSLTYHHVEHTRQVYRHCQELAADEHVTGDDLTLLLTAAAYHDTGFLRSYQGHEDDSCAIAREELPRFGYSAAQLEQVCACIVATRLPQRPRSLLDRIICDADLYYLGTDDYAAISETLYQEWQAVGQGKTRDEWWTLQHRFLDTHTFCTAAARHKLAARQQAHLLALPPAPEPAPPVAHGFPFGDVGYIVAGVVVAAFALKSFLAPNNFFDGGVTGIALLLHEIYHFNLAVAILLVNLPLIIAGYFTVGRAFAFKTLACIVLLGGCLLLIPFPVVTSDKLLVSVFGGFFLGIGIGLTMRAGCAIDGIEVLALYTWRRTSFTISEVILGLNVVIFCIAAFKFGIPSALYSILTYFTATKVVDYVVEGLEAYTGVTIISGESELIKNRLVNDLGRGITVYKGERGFLPGRFHLHEDCDIIFTVITRLELRHLRNLISEVDPQAFVFASTIRETSGGILKRRHAH